MTKNEFLTELRSRLEGMFEADRNQSLDYYSEMIDDRMEDGLSEEEAVAAVGTPSELADQILGEMPFSKLVKAKVKNRRKMSGGEIALLIIGFPLWFPLLLAGVIVLSAFYISFWALIASTWITEASLGLAAVAGVLSSPLWLAQGLGWPALLMLSSGLFVAGIAIFGWYGCLYATKGLWLLGKKVIRVIKLCFVGKEAVQ